MYASSVAEWRYGVRCAPCGVWAVRACGARERARARERERRAAERAEAGDSGAERGEGTGQREGAERERERERESIADGTALRCGRGGSRHFRKPRDSSRGFFVCVVGRGRHPLHHLRRLSSCMSVKKKICGAKTKLSFPKFSRQFFC